jgi:hypothetical protein
MSPISYKLTLFGLLAACCLVPLAACAHEGIAGEITKSFTVSPGGQLLVDTDIGSVEVATQPGNTVTVNIVREADTDDKDRAEKIFSDFEVEFSQDGNDVLVNAEYFGSKRGWSLWGGNRSRLQVRFLITVPPEYDVEILTKGGSVTVGDLKGEVHAVTSGGSLVFDKIDGPVTGRTSGGSIELESCAGSADVETSGGSISIGRVSGDVVARTSGGSILVDEVMGAIDAATSGGSVEATITIQPKSDCRLVTSGGNVTVHLADGIAVDIDAKTSGGRVRNNFRMKITDGEISKSSWRAQLNDGGPELYLRTSGGNILLSQI